MGNKMKKPLMILVLMIIAVYAFAQAPDTLWTKTFGGIASDEGKSVQQTIDGGYIIVGYTSSYGAGNSDILLIKTDSLGNQQWSQTFGGINYEYAESVQECLDGGFIIAGQTNSYGAGEYDVWLIKTDENGNQQWSQTYGGSGSDGAKSVQQTTDGGFILCGYANSYDYDPDFWLIKTDENGIEIWNNTFGGTGSGWGVAESVQQTADGGYVIAGTKNNTVWLIKTDTIGIEQWNQYYGNNDTDRAYSVHQTTDEGYILTGYSQSSYGSGGTELLLIKTDENGIEEFLITFGGSGNEFGFSVQQTIDTGFMIAGSTSSYGSGDSDSWFIKTDCNGFEEWSQTLGGSYEDEAFSVKQTTDSGYIITGQTKSYGAGGNDVWLLKIAPDFIPAFICNPHFGYSSLEVDFTDETQIAPTGWNWDFQNDGIIDSYEQNPTYNYNQAGVYDVKLIVERGTRSETLIKENLILVQESQLQAPQNPIISKSGNDIILNWDSVTDADYYLIYTASQPDGDYEYLNNTSGLIFTHTNTLIETDKLFYVIIGFDGTMEDLTRFIINNQSKNFKAEVK